MTEKDLFFLHNFINFVYMNHYVVAVSLLQTAISPEGVAIEVHEKLQMASRDEAVKMSESLATGARVQDIIVPRLYAEYAASIEDLGALLSSISYRGKDLTEGIMVRYLNSQVREVGDFFDKVIEYPDENFGNLLKLPQLDLLQDKELKATIESQYDYFSESILELARQYRTIYDVLELDSDNKESPYFPNNHLFVLTGIKNKSEFLKTNKKRGTMANTFNKIKHRFMLIEDFKSFVHKEPNRNDLEIQYAIQSRSLEWAMKLVNNIAVVTIITVEIASMLILLEENGLNI